MAEFEQLIYQLEDAAFQYCAYSQRSPEIETIEQAMVTLRNARTAVVVYVTDLEQQNKELLRDNLQLQEEKESHFCD